MKTALHLVAFTLLLAASHLSAATLYVSPGSNPTPPYTNWATAATSIQQAVDAAAAGDEVVVTNGVYASGGRVAGTNSLLNRVAITKPLAVRSANGPQFTTILGHQLPVLTNGTGAIRCAYLTNGASLSGFTLNRGATLTNGNGYGFLTLDTGGGAVCCESANALITNCVLTSSAAWNVGGGAFGGTLNNCTLGRNWTPGFGGAAYGSVLNSCIVSNNWGDSGGGVYRCVVNNCVLAGNIAGGVDGFGGGARNSTVNNCTLVGNSAWLGGGATGYPDVWACVLNNCILWNNFAQYSGNNASVCTQNYCWTDADPLFVDYASSNLRLQSNSPCINAGNNNYATGATDLDGNPRIVNGTVDIGAYEYQDIGSVIPYAWLRQYGLPVDGSADYADPDHDGMNNWQEWVCGTNPTNALSVLTMLSAAATNNPAGILVTWQSVSGIAYFLQRSTDLSQQPAFSTIQSNIFGQTGTTSYKDTNAIGAGPFFYRVGVTGP